MNAHHIDLHHSVITDPQIDHDHLSVGSGKCCDKSAGGCDCEGFIAIAGDSTTCACGHSWSAHY
ncbi:MAG: hypothetical protein ACRBDL_09345 [Alphaproteobacteria bacterium]